MMRSRSMKTRYEASCFRQGTAQSERGSVAFYCSLIIAGARSVIYWWLCFNAGDWGSVVGQHRDPSAAEFAIRRTLQELTSQHLAGIAESLGSQLGVLEQLVCDAKTLISPEYAFVPAESNVQDWRELARTLLTKEHGGGSRVA